MTNEEKFGSADDFLATIDYDKDAPLRLFKDEAERQEWIKSFEARIRNIAKQEYIPYGSEDLDPEG